MLSLVFTFGDKYSERILREFLLRTDQPDELKRAVFGMLKHLSAKEPYQAYLNGRWISGRVNLLDLDYKMPPSYESVMQLLMQYMLGNCREECATEAANIFRRYVESLKRKFPRISAAQEISFAAALEYLGRKSCGETVTEEEIGEIYRVTKPRLRERNIKAAAVCRRSQRRKNEMDRNLQTWARVAGYPAAARFGHRGAGHLRRTGNIFPAARRR